MADPISGGNQVFRRRDGGEYPNERHVGGFEKLRDNMIPVIVIGLLAWLCMGQINLQAQVAVLVERSTSQTLKVQENSAGIQGLRVDTAHLQSEIDDLREKRR